MGRIRRFGTAAGLRVSVAGRLTMNDMGRFEHAYGAALVKQPLQLELDLRAVTWLDATARAVIDRLTARGATVIAPSVADLRSVPAASGQRRSPRCR